jgi:surface protein
MISIVILSGMFIGCQAVVYKPADLNELETATKACIDGTYYSGTCTLCTKSNPHEVYGTIGDWNVSDITSFKKLFQNFKTCQFGSEWDISKWDVSSVTNMDNTFSAAESMNVNLSSWDVSRVTNMYGMFHGGAGYLTTEFDPGISDWDVSSVTMMGNMFHANANVPSRFVSDLSKWDVSSVTYMAGMLQGCYRFNSDLSKWDVSQVTTMRQMFAQTTLDGISGFVGFDLSRWNIGKVTIMHDFIVNGGGNIFGWDFVYHSDITRCTMADSRVSKYKKCEYCPISGGCTGVNSMRCKRSFTGAYPLNPTVDVQSFTCGCDTGSYKNVDWATAQDVPFDPDASPCFLCPVGTYQDQPDQLSCETCPSGRSTTVLGSTLETECLNATDIRDKFLEERNPELVPAYNIANSCV